MTIKRLQNTGDTIVEVLIALAVISLILAISYATSIRNVRSLQDAQERAQALQLAQGQIEYIRAAQNPNDQVPQITAAQQCFNSDGKPVAASTPPTQPGDPSDFCLVDASDHPVSAGQQPQFNILITPATNVATGITSYTIQVTWPSIINSTTNNVTVYYRL